MRNATSLLNWIGPIALLLIISGSAQGKATCTAADSLRKAGYLDEAKTEYTELLKGEDKPQCAVEGLLETYKAEQRKKAEVCAAAEALLKSGYLEEAKNAYVELLSGDGATKPDCAREGLIGVKEEEAAKRKETISRAQALADFGLHDDAFDTIKEQLKKDDKTEVPQELQYLSGGKVPVWRMVRRDMEPWARPILEIFAAVILLIVLKNLMFRRFAKRTLAIEEFDSGGFEGKYMGKDFSFIMRSQLNRTAAGSRRGCINLVTGPIQDIKIPPEVEAAVPTTTTSWLSPATWVKAIPALFTLVAPIRTVSLMGYLHKRGTRGVGITVQLVEKNKILASYTFWQMDFDDSSERSEDEAVDSLYQLAEYAAVWLLFEMAKNLRKGLALLGTHDWQSYAYFRAGLFAKNQNRRQAEKDLYLRALMLDPKLRGARVNLAKWFLWDKNPEKNPEAALEHLIRAKKDSLDASDGDRDPTLYSAIYNLAVLKYENGDINEAKELTQELLEKIDSTLKKTKGFLRIGYKDPALKYHLKSIRPEANSMLGGLMVELGEAGGLKRIQDETKLSSVFPSLQYNLACCYSILAHHEPQVKPGGNERREQYLQASLSHLERTFQIDASLACQVKDDRSLEYVRNEKAAEYKALIDTYETATAGALEPEPELLLAEVHIIGDEHAQKLLDEDIQTQDELLQETLNPEARENLATKLNVTEQLVTKWAHAMDLLRIVGLGPPQLKLLALADIHRLTELEASSPASLKALLDDLSKAGGEIDPPDITAVNTWVNDAKANTKPKVS